MLRGGRDPGNSVAERRLDDEFEARPGAWSVIEDVDPDLRVDDGDALRQLAGEGVAPPLYNVVGELIGSDDLHLRLPRGAVELAEERLLGLPACGDLGTFRRLLGFWGRTS